MSQKPNQKTKHTYPLGSGIDVSDIVLRTSDGHTFHTHKILLRKHSPVFTTMLATGQGTVEELEIPEDSNTMEPIFTLIYEPHGDHILFTDIDSFITTLQTAIKYEMRQIVTQISMQLGDPDIPNKDSDAYGYPTIVDGNPFRIYTVGDIYGIPYMRDEAWEKLQDMDLDLEPDFPEIHQMSADWYRALKAKQREARRNPRSVTQRS